MASSVAVSKILAIAVNLKLSGNPIESLYTSYGLIVRIGEWVLREACRQGKAWLDDGLVVGRVAVNVSVQQFVQRKFVDLVIDVLRESGLEPHTLELEITEGLMLRDTDGTIRTLAALQGIGVQMAIDDFGTGYSSLSYLKRLPIDRLKIDQAFVNAEYDRRQAVKTDQPPIARYDSDHAQR